MDAQVGSLSEEEEKILTHFSNLYGPKKSLECLSRLKEVFKNYGFNLKKSKKERDVWDETDAVLVTYGDVIQGDGEPEKPSLPILESFLDEYLQDVISTVHILSFFPSSSDAGFSVIDYKKVREDLGSWEDIQRISDKYRLMTDLVINHASRFNDWFKNYQDGVSPGKDYFISVDPNDDLSAVTRPRSSPLLSTVRTKDGLRHLWTTFSADQIDFDFSNPDVLFEFIDIFFFYYKKGIRVFRLDAIAYLWKKIGTHCIHLEETHEIVKLFRTIVECIDPDITLITETNVPLEENLSYFGDQDETHMVYQFSLPPLLLHAILTENSQYLTEWAIEMPDLPEGSLFLNFTASHDGIGVRPLEGLVPQDEFDYLVRSTKERGGFVSYKKNEDNGQSPYELNITYFDAFEEPGNPNTKIQIQRYLCSQIIMLSLKGVPGIYFHNLTSTNNDMERVLESGEKRDINRKQWQRDELLEFIEGKNEKGYCALNDYKKLLKERRKHPAFHPSADQKTVNIDDQLFAFLRVSLDETEKIAVISNISSAQRTLKADKLTELEIREERIKDLISKKTVLKNGLLKLDPFQTVWLPV